MKRAKFFNNVTEAHFFDIPLENVEEIYIYYPMYTCYTSQIRCVYLGYILSLGIFDRLWTLLEDACTELDFRMAGVNHGEDVVGSDSFVQYSIALQQRSSL